MDSQTQLAEQNNDFSNGSFPETSSPDMTGTDAEMVSSTDPLTDQAIADSIQSSLESEPSTPSTTALQSKPSLEPSMSTMSTQISAVSSQIADFWREFSQSSRPFLISFAWVLVTLIALKILSAVVNAVNGIPLMAPLFQLIGVGYAVWFTNRYLLKRSTRQELSQKIKNFTGQAFEQPSSSSLSVSVANTDLAVSNATASDPVMLEE